jgi:hypothetical protein
MTQTVEEYFQLNPHPYAPKVFKPECGQYDNFQINDFYANDTVWDDLTVEGRIISSPADSLFNNFLAVQAVYLYGEIECNFELIAKAYP